MFYIKRISIKTENGTVSSINLDAGLNIIYGQSNTGKSLVLDCIDYMFGASEHRFDAKLKIEQITMVLDVDGINITMRRNVGSNDVEVSSSVEGIDSGTYKIGKTKNSSLSDLWLYLLGIEERTKIIQTKSYKWQDLTLRTFYHTFLIDETRTQGQASILAPGQGVTRGVSTAVLTALLYLATKNNYVQGKEGESPQIRKARRDAVKDFVDRSISKLSETKVSELADLPKETPEELQEKIDVIIDEIGAAEGALDKATESRIKLAERLYEIDGQIAESRVLFNRNESLLSQYAADIKRLTFIAEGDIEHGSIPSLDTCPFCNGKLTKDKSESCVDAAIAEVKKIESQIKDLRSVQESIKKEITDLIAEKETTIQERNSVDEMIRGELQPQIRQLKDHLKKYKMALGQYKAKEMIERFSDVLIKELEVTEKEESEPPQFDAKGKFEEVFQSSLNDNLKILLEACNYQNFTAVRFDTDDYDVVVNGHLKKSQGQGFRAFLNTVLAIALQNCLDGFDNYSPHMLVVDSPILSLSEKEDHSGDEHMSETMKAGLFHYFVDHKDDRQTIIIENEIPDIDYDGVNLIEFTKDENRDRYGLLDDYRE